MLAFFFLFLVAVLPLAAQSPLPLMEFGAPYRQNFDSLEASGAGSALPAGWGFAESGANANATYTASSGAANSGDTYSFGSAGSADRAFGGLQSGSLIPTVGAAFLNRTGRTITSLAIEYRGEQWRLGTSGRGSDRLDFQYSTTAADLAATGAWVDVNDLDLLSPVTTGAVGELDGNANAITVRFTITGLSIPDGATFRIRWTDFNASGADDGLGIDDFSLTPSDEAGAPPPATITAIHDIQGPGLASPVADQRVATEGIVTAVISNGFFLQTPDGLADADPRTSEGIFVFTATAPTVAPGDAVRVTGTVIEFVPAADPQSPPLTEILNPSVTLVSSNNPLPAAVEINSSLLSAQGGVSQLEPLEGMRISVARLVAVSPVSGTVNETNATGSNNGVFYGVLPGVAPPAREPGIDVNDRLPVCAAGRDCAIPVFDANPERLRVDSDAVRGTSAVAIAAAAEITGVTGVLHYGFRTYTIFPDATVRVATPGQRGAASLPDPPANSIAIASMNVQRLFDDANDPAVNEPVVAPAAYRGRLRKIASTVRNVLRSPDVVVLAEVENEGVANALAATLNDEAWAAGESSPEYVAALAEGNDPGGIDVALLVRTSTVRIERIDQFGYDSTYRSPCGTQQNEVLNDRPPLRLRATSVQGSMPFTVFANHLRSLSGIDDATLCGNGRTEGDRVRLKRAAQADFTARMIAAELDENPNANLVVAGDFNAFEFNDGYVDVLNLIAGNPAPATQVAVTAPAPAYPKLTNLQTLLPAGARRHSYMFDGNRQALDHILLSPAAAARVAAGAYVSVNADYPETLRGDFTRPERYSDHDPVIVYLRTPRQEP